MVWSPDNTSCCWFSRASRICPLAVGGFQRNEFSASVAGTNVDHLSCAGSILAESGFSYSQSSIVPSCGPFPVPPPPAAALGRFDMAATRHASQMSSSTVGLTMSVQFSERKPLRFSSARRTTPGPAKGRWRMTYRENRGADVEKCNFGKACRHNISSHTLSDVDNLPVVSGGERSSHPLCQAPGPYGIKCLRNGVNNPVGAPSDMSICSLLTERRVQPTG